MTSLLPQFVVNRTARGMGFLDKRKDLHPSCFAGPVVCAAILLAACTSQAPRATATSGESPAPGIATAPATAVSAPPSLSPTPTVETLLASPTIPLTTLPPPTPRLVVLAENLGSPDDLLLAPDDSIYFSDIGDGTIKRLDTDGKVSVIISKLQEPEGMVLLPDGRLVLAEQGKNRLLAFGLNTKQLTIFTQLQNKTGRAGVDGIVFDPKSGTIIVPDSPNGTLLRVSGDGKNAQIIARGMVRPTGAAIESDGTILVADENGNAIRRVPASGGAAQTVTSVPVPDDVIVDGEGNIYVNTLGDGAIHHIDVRTGRDQILWRGLSDPQGIVFDDAGNLILSDPGNHRIVKIIIK